MQPLKAITIKKTNIEDPAHTEEGQRLDIWLYRARFFKTRGLAAKMITKGKVRITRNGKTERVKKPHTLIRPGHEALFMRGNDVVHIEMLAPALRRGPAREAVTLYNVLESQTQKGKTPG